MIPSSTQSLWAEATQVFHKLRTEATSSSSISFYIAFTCSVFFRFHQICVKWISISNEENQLQIPAEAYDRHMKQLSS